MMFYKETNFKETPIGIFPKDWKVIKVDKLFNLYKGTTPSTKVKEYWNGNIPFVTPTDVTRVSDLSEIYIKTTESYITEKGLESKGLKLVPANSLLFTSRATIGYLAINKVKVAINQGIISLIPKNKDIDIIFYYYFFQKLRGLFENLAGGSTYKEISMSTFSNVSIPFPSFLEQQKIAEILSTIDEAIQKTDEIIVKTERLKKGLMQELLTRGIGHREFKDTEIGRIPKDWEVVRLQEIAEDIYYGITAKAVDVKTKLRMLRTTDIKGYSVDWNTLPFCEITEKRGNINRFLLKQGDLIIARAGTTGVSVLVEKDLEETIFGSYLIKVRLSKKVFPKFMHYFCQSHFYWNHITTSQEGSTLKNISLPILESLNVPLPPLSEQQKIAEVLSTVDIKLEIEKKEKSKLERIKQGLMDLLLTGKVRVRVN